MTSAKHQTSRFIAIFASGTMISRVLGLVRDIAITAYLPGLSRAAFIVAFRFPNTFRDMVGEGAMNAAIVPVLSETIETKSQQEFKELIGAALSAMLLILIGMTILGVLFMPYLPGNVNELKLITGAEHRDAESVELMVSLTRWTFPYLLFIGLAVFAIGPLFTVKHYTTPSWSPSILNIIMIVCCVGITYPSIRGLVPDPAYLLVIGVWLGGILHVVVHFAALRKYTGVWLPNFHLRHPGVRQILWLMAPVVLGQSAGEINKLVDNLFSASLGDGPVIALYCANRLVQLPLGVFGVATSVAILPTLSRAVARDDIAEVRTVLMHGFRQSFFLVAPAMVGLIVLGHPIVELLFQHREFTSEDTTRTVMALTPYALGLLGFAWVKVAVTGFYAEQDTKSPVIIASASMLLNLVLNMIMVRPFGFRGLAYATLIAYAVNFLLLFFFLCRRYGKLWDEALLAGLFRIVLAAGVMAVVTYAVYLRVHIYFPDDHTLSQLVCVGSSIAAAAASYAAMALALQSPELKEFMSVFRRGQER